MQGMQWKRLLSSLLVVPLVACGGDSSTESECRTSKCDGFDVPEEDVEETACDGELFDRSGRKLGNARIAGRLTDPLVSAALSDGADGTCPTTFAAIMDKLEAANCGVSFTQFVSETAQILNRPTQYRSVTTVNCDAGKIWFAQSGLTSDGQLPVNAEIIAQDESSGVFNYYKTETDRIDFFGSSTDMLSGPLEDGDRDCAGCHTHGGLIMKELDAPWLHWESLENGVSTPGVRELLANHRDILGERGDGSTLEFEVRRANTLWNRARVAHMTTERSVKEMLRPIFCADHVEVRTSPQGSSPFEGVSTSAPLAGVIVAEGRFAEVEDLNFSGAVYDALLRANNQQIAGIPEAVETIFELAHAVRSSADEQYVRSLVLQGMIPDGFVDDVRSVDLTQPVFSDDRCGLLEFAPDLEGERRTAEAIRNGFIANLVAADPAEGSPAAELLNNLSNTDSSDASGAFVSACFERTDTVEVGDNATEVPAMLKDYMTVVSQNRRTASDMRLFEFDESMPQDTQPIEPGTRFDPVTCTLETEFRAVAEPVDLTASCAGRCGRFEPDKSCQCNFDCEQHGDCCEDRVALCERPQCDLCTGLGQSKSPRCVDPRRERNVGPADQGCVAKICTSRSSCCEGSFDASCRAMVETVCGLSCDDADDSE